ncbi:MAG: PspA/IM30 family protein [Candidatus Omnitrophica bacterium]|nr:PspA/IM30 family protein [Candidatus Omnitrophota bacterium]
MKKLSVFLIIFFMACPCVFAQDIENKEEMNGLKEGLQTLKAQFEEMKSNYETKITQLETKVEQLKQQTEVVEAKAAQVPQAPQTGLGRYSQNFNPDISVIGDFTFHGTDKKSDEQYNQFKMRQAELAFSAPVDPYSRADLFLHVEPSGEEWKIGLCEGYLTLLNLPIENLQGKIGKFKANFGKVNRLHLHSLPWVDYPNVLTNFLGEEGMSQSGVSASYLIPNPWDKYLELTFEAINNRNSASFAGSQGRDMVYLAHLKNFFDLNEESTLELGGSIATGPNDDGHGKNRTTLEGIDLTYKWRPLKEGLYKSITFQNEFLFSQKDQTDTKQVDSWGAYSSLQYQFAKRLSAFGRYDYSEFPGYANRYDNAVSTGLTFAQSEYCFWRLQFKHTDKNYSKDSDEIWLQCNFGLGPHRKHEY